MALLKYTMFLALNAATVEAEHGGILHAPQSDNDSIQIRRRPLNRAEAQSLCLYGGQLCSVTDYPYAHPSWKASLPLSLFLRLRYLFQRTEFAGFCCYVKHPSPFLLTVYEQSASNQGIMNRSHL